MSVRRPAFSWQRMLPLLACLLSIPLEAAPSIETQPAAAAVFARDNAALSVSATGGSLSYQWYVGTAGDISSPVPGATGSLLVSPPVVADTSFWVRVSDSTGFTDSETVTVTVAARPPLRLTGTGDGTYGELGDGTHVDRTTPIVIAGDVASFAAGGNFSLYATSDGSLWTAGYNYHGQLGDGSTVDRNVFRQVADGAVAVAAGGSHGMFLKADHTLWGMGSNYFGALGDGTTTTRTKPVKCADDVVLVALGSSHTLFVKSDGTLWGTGYGGYGQLGAGSNRTIPSRIAENVVSISAGGDNSMFVKSDGSLWAMGNNTWGQIGDGTTTHRYAPVQVATGVARVSLGIYHACFLKTDGSLWSMGSNYYGNLGDGTTVGRKIPWQVSADVISVQAGAVHGFFEKSDRSVWAMGANGNGQLGDGTTVNRLSPVQVGRGPLVISSGSGHTLFGDRLPVVVRQPADTGASAGGRTTLSIEAGGSGPLGFQWYLGSSGDTATPLEGGNSGTFLTPAVNAPTSFWVRVSNPHGSVDSRTVLVSLITGPVIETQPLAQAVAMDETAALQVGVVGEYLSYQWFQGNAGDVSAPLSGATGPLLITRPAQAVASYWVRVTNPAGSVDSEAVLVTPGPAFPATLLATGSNYSGAFGLGTTSGMKSPMPIARRVTSAAGTGAIFIVRDDGTAWAAGSDHYPATYTFRQVASDISRVAGGSQHGLLLKNDGTLLATGRNSQGQLGDGTYSTRATPVQVASSVVSIAAGNYFSMFIKSDGTLWAMGNIGPRSTVPVKLADSVAMAAGGGTHALFLKTDGSLWGLGGNSSGQLGDGTKTDRPQPVQLASGVAFAAAGYASSYFITSDGSLWGVGSNGSNQLGPDNSSLPGTPVKMASSVKSVAAGSFHCLFLKTDGSTWAVGSNSSGQLGDGTTSNRSTPVRIAVSAASIVAASDFSLIRDLAPAIDREPADIGVLPGTSSELTVSAAGGPPLGYQWYAGESGNTDTPIAGAVSASFLPPADSGATTYWVRVANAHGSVDSRAARMEEVTAPAIATAPQAVSSALTGSIGVSASGGMLSYQWFRGETGDTSDPVAGAVGPLLVTQPPSSATRYWVRVSNLAGSVDSATAVLPPWQRVPSTFMATGSAGAGQLGTGASSSIFKPTPIATGAARVASGANHTLVLKSDGSLWATGLNTVGQLGDGTTTTRRALTPISSGVIAMAAAGDFSVFVKTGGTLWITGFTGGPVPRQISTGVASVWTGRRTLYILKTNGSLYSRAPDNVASETLISSGVLSASAGDNHFLYLKTDGSLWGGGLNSDSQLGNTPGYNVTVPVKLASEVAAAAAGPACSYFVKKDGSLWAMGANLQKQTGNYQEFGTTPFPVCITTGVSTVSAGGSHALFTRTDGSLWGLGLDASGQLGDGTARTRSLPIRIAREVISFSGGVDSSVFVTKDGTLWGCGSDVSGQLGGLAAPASPVPAKVADDILAISAGRSHSLLVTADGLLKATGANESGQLGDGTRAARSVPVTVATDVAMASAGQFHSLFVKTDGTLWGMGANTGGELGTAPFTDQPAPVLIASGVASAAAGSYHSLFLKRDGTLWAMGRNSDGQLGTGNSTNHLGPVQIDSQVVAMTAGDNHSLFLKSDGSLWAAGRNTSGQLGNGTTTSRHSPERIATGVTGIAAGALHSLFLKSDGTVWSMGSGSRGRLGDGGTTSRLLPVQVATGAVSVAAGESHSLILKADGSLWAMGANNLRQLGDGTTTDRTTPVRVADRVSAISAGGSHSGWLTADTAVAATAIARQPESRTVASGTPVTLSAVVAGEEISLQWYSGLSGNTGSPVSGATSPDFTTPPLTADTFYWLRATGASGTADSPAVRIAVRAVPAVVSAPVLLGYLPNGGARLAVTGSAETESYQWFAGASGDVSRPLPGATAATVLTLPVKQSTSCWVRLSSPAGSADSVAIEIPPPPPAAGRILKAVGSTFGNLRQLDGAVSAISAGRTHSLFVKTNDTLWAVGANDFGQLGNGTREASASPVRIAGGVTAAAAGKEHSLFVKADGTLWAMGRNEHGQLGDGSLLDSQVPVLIAADVVSVAAGNSFSAFVKTDGSLWTMGNNWFGVLGDGSYRSQSTPVRVAEDVVAISAGDEHLLLLKSDGSLLGSGQGFYQGYLANHATNPSGYPQNISEGVVTMAAGGYHSLFLTADGFLKSMGENYQGQLGYGSLDSQWPGAPFNYFQSGSSMVPNIVTDGVTSMAAGATHSLWVKNDGSLWAVGNNRNGQLAGTSGALQSLPPAKVQNRAHLASAAGDNTLFLTTNSTAQPPALLGHPETTLVPDGGAATFTVVASGGAPLSYQWYLGETGDVSRPIAGATSASYTSGVLTAGITVWVKVSNSAAWAESRDARAIAGPATAGYLQWAASQSSGEIDLSPAADPDGDLRNNLLEYATGTAAGSADVAPAGTATRTGEAAEFHLRLRGDPGLRLSCRLTEDFHTWQIIPLHFTGSSWNTADPTLTITAATPAGDGTWNLTLSHPNAPGRLFLAIGVE